MTGVFASCAVDTKCRACRLDTQEISVRKSGGTFELHFGGVLTVQADTVSKRTTVTCARVPDHQRYRFEPTLRWAQLYHALHATGGILCLTFSVYIRVALKNIFISLKEA